MVVNHVTTVPNRASNMKPPDVADSGAVPPLSVVPMSL